MARAEGGGGGGEDGGPRERARRKSETTRDAERKTVVIENLLAATAEDCPRPLDKQRPTVRVEVFNGSDGGERAEERRGREREREEEKRLDGKKIEDTRKTYAILGRGGISLISPSSSDATRNERRNNFPRCKNGGEVEGDGAGRERGKFHERGKILIRP